MANSAKTPHQISKEIESFSIPLYQRLFTWTPKEIKSLLDDLYNQYKNNNEHYYVGLLTSTHDNELVDGQQRFTVLMLMGIVMREKYPQWNNFIKHENGQLRLTFTAREDDEEYLRSKVDTKENDIVVTNDYMEAGIKEIHNYIYDEKRIPNPEKFCKYVYEHFAFFIQKLPEGYSGRMLNKYFESMNSTGRNLESHEILKVELLDRAGITENKEGYDRLVTMWNIASRMNQTILSFYDEQTRKKYQNVISSIGDYLFDDLIMISEKSKSIMDVILNPPTIPTNIKGEIKRTMRSFLSFTDFLLQVLYIILKDNNITPSNLQEFFKPDNLRTTFKFYEKHYDAKSFIETMFKYKVILDWAVVRIDGQGDYDLAMAKSENSCLQQYEAMLFASSSRDTYYQWVPFVLTTVMNGIIDEKSILEALKQKDNKNHPFPNECSFAYKSFDNYYFRRLDYYLWEQIIGENKKSANLFSKEIPEEYLKEFRAAVNGYKFHQFNSVEHLHPQNEDNQIVRWQTPNGDYDEEAINQFGNLALISSNFNSTQNNDSLNPKFGRIRDHITQKKLESIKLSIMYYEAGGKSEQWTSELAKKHGDKMFNLLKNTYCNY